MSEQTKKYFTGAEVDALLAQSQAAIEAKREIIPGPAQGGRVWNPETTPKPYQPVSKTAGRIAAGATIIASLGFFALFYIFNNVLEQQFYLDDLYKIYRGWSNQLIATVALDIGFAMFMFGIMLMIHPKDAGYFNILRPQQSIMTYITVILGTMCMFLPMYAGVNAITLENQDFAMNNNYGAVVQQKIEDKTGTKVSIKKALELGNYRGAQNGYRNEAILKTNGKEYEVSTKKSFYYVEIFVSEVKDQKIN